MPGLKIFMDCGQLQHIFGFMPSNETLENDKNVSTSPFVHDIERFHAIIVYTDFIDNTISRDVKALVLKSFPIDKPHFQITQGLISKSFHSPEVRRVLKHSFHSISIDLRSQWRINSFHFTWIHPFISFSGGCRSSGTDYFLIHFLSNTLTERLVIQTSDILKVLLDKEEGGWEI